MEKLIVQIRKCFHLHTESNHFTAIVNYLLNLFAEFFMLLHIF